MLGFSRAFAVPEKPPFVFGAVASGPVEIFLNDRSTVTKESPQMAGLAQYSRFAHDRHAEGS